MKLLLDANLSPRAEAILSTAGHAATHVADDLVAGAIVSLSPTRLAVRSNSSRYSTFSAARTSAGVAPGQRWEPLVVVSGGVGTRTTVGLSADRFFRPTTTRWSRVGDRTPIETTGLIALSRGPDSAPADWIRRAGLSHLGSLGRG